MPVRDEAVEDIMMRNQELIVENQKLREERDEARREVCIMLEDASNNHRENHAKRWGWDCFKENTR
jgi:hypothetical protein